MRVAHARNFTIAIEGNLRACGLFTACGGGRVNDSSNPRIINLIATVASAIAGNRCPSTAAMRSTRAHSVAAIMRLGGTGGFFSAANSVAATSVRATYVRTRPISHSEMMNIKNLALRGSAVATPTTV